MNIQKKGLAVDMIIKFMLGIIVLMIILISFIIGPDALLSKAKELIPKPSDFFKRTPAGMDPSTHQASTDAAIEKFTEFMGNILDLQKGMQKGKTNSCFYFIKEPIHYENLFNDFHITIEETGTLTAFYLNKDLTAAEKQTGTTPITVVAVQKITGIKPCLIQGTEAGTFYNNWLDKTSAALPAEGKPARDYKELFYTLNNEKIELISGERYDWETEGGPYVLYMHDNHLCFIPTRDGGGKCTYNSNSGLLDDDCFEKGEEDALFNQAEKHNAYIYDVQAQSCVQTITSGGSH